VSYQLLVHTPGYPAQKYSQGAAGSGEAYISNHADSLGTRAGCLEMRQVKCRKLVDPSPCCRSRSNLEQAIVLEDTAGLKRGRRRRRLVEGDIVVVGIVVDVLRRRSWPWRVPLVHSRVRCWTGYYSASSDELGGR
jgi:hypothetical protein